MKKIQMTEEQADKLVVAIPDFLEYTRERIKSYWRSAGYIKPSAIEEARRERDYLYKCGYKDYPEIVAAFDVYERAYSELEAKLKEATK